MWIPGLKGLMGFDCHMSKSICPFQFLPSEQQTSMFSQLMNHNYNPRQKQLGRLYNLTVCSPFKSSKKRVFSLLNISHPPYSMLGYNRTINYAHKHLSSAQHRARGRARKGKKRLKVTAFPTLLTMIVHINNAYIVPLRAISFPSLTYSADKSSSIMKV